MRTPLKVVLVSFFVYLFSWFGAFAIGVNDLTIQSEDTLPAIFLPVSILKEGTIYLDTYYDMMIERYPHPDDKDQVLGLTPFYLQKIGDHYLSAFPLISGLLALPVYFFPVIFGLPITWDSLAVLAHVSAALIVAISGGALFILVKKHFGLDEKKARLLTWIYLFGTINFALVSQGLWQHGALELFLILTLLFTFEKKYLLSGLALGLAILSRPTAAAIAPFLFLLVLLGLFKPHLKATEQKLSRQKTLALGKYFVGIALSAAFFYWYTNAYYLDVSNNGYSDQLFVGWQSRFPEGFLGLWLSPNKGILVYSPIFLFSLAGIYLLKKAKKLTSAESFRYLVFFGAVLTHTLILGRWKHWYGGWSFGYRMAADIIPFLVLLLVPFLQSDVFTKYKKLFYGFLVVSVVIQLFGIVFFDGIWHSAYDQGFENTAWLWSIKDGEFVFNIRRILVKLGYLERACPTCL